MKVNEQSIVDKLLAIKGQHLVKKKATIEQINDVEKKLDIIFPNTLKLLLQISNGGEFCFGRFEKVPFIPENSLRLSRENLLEHFSDQGVEGEEVNKLFPLCSDFGEGMYCLNYRAANFGEPTVCFSYWGADEEDITFVSNNLDEFIKQSIDTHIHEESKQQYTIRLENIVSLKKFTPVGVLSLEGKKIDLIFIDPYGEDFTKTNRISTIDKTSKVRFIIQSSCEEKPELIGFEPGNININQAKSGLFSNNLDCISIEVGSEPVLMPPRSEGWGPELKTAYFFSVSEGKEISSDTSFVLHIKL